MLPCQNYPSGTPHYWPLPPPRKNKYEINTLSKLNTAPGIFKSQANNILDDFKDHQKIFTDASKSIEGIGIEIIFKNSNSIITYYRLPNECSIFSAGAAAPIVKAIEKINSSVKDTNFLIFSDSLSAINSIKNKTNPSVI